MASEHEANCSKCDSKFANRPQDTIDRHCTYHHDGAKKPLNCKFRWCRKQFWSRRGLFNHLDKVHARKPRDRNNNNVAATAREATRRALRVKKEKIENDIKQEKQEIKKEKQEIKREATTSNTNEAEVEVIDLTEDADPPSSSPCVSPPILLLDPLAGVGSRVVTPGESPTAVYTYHPDAALAARLSTRTNAIPSPLQKWGPATLVKLGPARAKGAATAATAAASTVQGSNEAEESAAAASTSRRFAPLHEYPNPLHVPDVSPDDTDDGDIPLSLHISDDDDDDDIKIVHEDIKNMKTEK